MKKQTIDHTTSRWKSQDSGLYDNQHAWVTELCGSLTLWSLLLSFVFCISLPHFSILGQKSHTQITVGARLCSEPNIPLFIILCLLFLSSFLSSPYLQVSLPWQKLLNSYVSMQMYSLKTKKDEVVQGMVCWA